MDSISERGENKKGVISKMWKSFSDGMGRKVGSLHGLNRKSKSLPHRRLTVAPEGCFPIYVGAEKERFVIKTEQVNHPLFKILLEEAELEYGYGNKGLLMLPCRVDRFVDVLIEMEYCCEDKGRSFVAITQSSYHFLTPPRPIGYCLA